MAKRRMRRNQNTADFSVANASMGGLGKVRILCDNLPTGAGDGGGYVLLETQYGPEIFAWGPGPEETGEEPGGFQYDTYFVSVDGDPMSELDYVEWEGVASFIGQELSELEKLNESNDPCARAWLYDAVASYMGWHELDPSGPVYRTPMEMFAILGDQYFDEPRLDFEEYESYGPEEDEPESGLAVSYDGDTVDITEWTDIEAATGEEQPEGEKVLRQDASVEAAELLDPNAKHRGSYSGDQGLSYEGVLKLDADGQERAIVAAAISYLAYWGGEESFVDEVGD